MYAPRRVWWRCSTAPSAQARVYASRRKISADRDAGHGCKASGHERKDDTVTMMSYGFDPYLSSWSPYHGAVYAVLESVARSWQRWRLQQDPLYLPGIFPPHDRGSERWSQPFAALLGAYEAQIGFGLPSIGGKDSMSGTFEHIDVPPTLVSFAVDVAKVRDIITPELKKAGTNWYG